MQEYNHAWQLTGQLRSDEAVPIPKGIIAKDKTFYRAYHGLVEAYAQKKALDLAREYFHILITEDPNNALAYYGLAQLEETVHNYPEQGRNYLECLKRGPHIAACYPVGLSTAPLSPVSEALASEFERLLPADLNDPFRYLGLFNLFSMRAQPQKSCAAAQEASAKLDGTEQLDITAAFLNRANCPGHDEAGLAHALRLYEIMKELEDWEGEMGATLSLAEMYRLNGRFEDGRALLERYLGVLRGLGHLRGEASCLSQMRNLNRFHGDLDAAIEFGWKAKRMWDEVGEFAQSMDALYIIEKMYREQGRLKEARDLLEDLPAQAGRAGDRKLQALTLSDKGSVSAELGDYFKAIQYERESIAVFESLEMRWQAGAGLGMLAIHYTSLGDYNTALEYYRQSLESARRFQDNEEVKRNLFNLGDAYLRMDRPREALAALEESRHIQSTFPWFNCRVLVNMGRTYLRLGQLPNAARYFEEALQEARSLESRRYEGEALAGLAEVQLRRDHLAAAGQLFG